MTTEPNHFFQFWNSYPNKVAKLAAQRAWLKAAKIATFQEIMDGVDRYKKNKPEHVDYCYPASWLNGGRWMDEYAASPKQRPSPSVEAIQNQSQLTRVEARIEKLRNLKPFGANKKLADEFELLLSKRKELLGLLNFAA